jgi:AraC family transcriptional regulator
MLSDACASRYFRHVSGEVVSTLTAQTSVARIEIFRRRQSEKAVEWQFCQPEMTLFWHRQGFHRMHGSVDGTRINCDFAGGSNLSLFAPEAQIRTAFETGEHCDYVAVFFDRDKVRANYGIELSINKVGFNSEALRRGLMEISREAEQPDDMFDLFAEGWSLQALANVSRVARTNAANFLPKGGLPARTVKKLESYVRENIASEIRLEALSDLAGLSKRHFLRAFAESLGTTPHRYVLCHRIEAAKQRLCEADCSIIEVALESGFTHAQHFSTAFRRVTGKTPSEYRKSLRE